MPRITYTVFTLNTLNLKVGTALGLAVSTIVFNTELSHASAALGVHIDKSGTNAPKPAQLTAYKDAMWVGFAFGMFGMHIPPFLSLLVRTHLDIVGTLLAVLVLRGVGIVGHQAPRAQDTEHGEDPEKASA